MTKATLIYNARLLDEANDTPGAVLVVNGKIRSVFHGYYTDADTVVSLSKAVLKEDGVENTAGVDVYDAEGLTVTPSFIDMHVHLRDPGLTHKENLETGLKACIAGGYGTVVAMPNTNPVISSIEQVREVRERASKLLLSNLFQTSSITKSFEGKDVSHLMDLNKEEVPVITEDGKEVASSAVMLEGMKIAAGKGIIVACHSEDPELAAAARPLRKSALDIMKEYNLPAWGGSSADSDFVPEEALEEIDAYLTKANQLLEMAEDIATERNITLARQAGCHIHLCHVSTAGSIEYIRKAKERLMDEAADFYADMADAAYDCSLDGNQFKPLPPVENGFSVTCEVTPHHIALCGTEEPNIRALVNPPLRSEDDRIMLIDAIRDGTVDCISTDHAPHTLEDKAGGAPGFTGIETSYGVCNTVLVKEGQISAKRLSQLMSANPARILGLKKGLIKTGYDADLTVVNPDEQWIVDSRLFYSKGKATPFEGRTLTGKVKTVFINGRKIFES